MTVRNGQVMGEQIPQLSMSFPREVIDAIALRVVELLADHGNGPHGGYLDVEAAAAYLCAPPSRIYDLKAQGRLTAYRDGRRLLFRREDLDECLVAEVGPAAMS